MFAERFARASVFDTEIARLLGCHVHETASRVLRSNLQENQHCAFKR